jgi:hypothetical protein
VISSDALDEHAPDDDGDPFSGKVKRAEHEFLC